MNAPDKLVRQNAMLERLTVALREFKRKYRLSDSEAWHALINLAAHDLAHKSGLATDEEIDALLTRFADSVRMHWTEHKRDCMGKGQPH